MQTFRKISLIGILATLLFTFSITAQEEVNPADSTGLPGDNFSLEGAIELFKNSASLEEYEKLLNAQESNVNNLDLNEDGETDYIRVVDNMDADVHAIVLQVPVSETESQDIAVIEIEKTGKEEAILQIVGDEDVFGSQTIAEPFEEEAQDNGKGGPSVDITFTRIVVNVWFWRPVRFIYAPTYVVWVSPYRWHYYPVWWRPWRPRPWRTFHIGVRPYHRHYHVVHTHRVVRAHKVYAPRRTHSKVVHTRTTTKVAARGGHGRKVGVSRTTTTTTVKGKNGRVAKKQTTTTKAGVKGRNGRVAKKQTTTTKAGVKGKRGSVTKKKTTTKAGVKGRKGRAAGGKKTTRVTKKRRKG
ncbi:MAG: hypothetical protein ACE5FF_05755 [Saprospiraceae bacterium]